MSLHQNADKLEDIRRDILGLRSHLDSYRFRALRIAIQQLTYPWDAFLVTGLALTLWALAAAGALVLIRSGGTPGESAIGFVMIGVAAVSAANLVVER